MKAENSGRSRGWLSRKKNSSPTEESVLRERDSMRLRALWFRRWGRSSDLTMAKLHRDTAKAIAARG